MSCPSASMRAHGDMLWISSLIKVRFPSARLALKSASRALRPYSRSSSVSSSRSIASSRSKSLADLSWLPPSGGSSFLRFIRTLRGHHRSDRLRERVPPRLLARQLFPSERREPVIAALAFHRRQRLPLRDD